MCAAGFDLQAQDSSETLAQIFTDVEAYDKAPQDSLYRGFHPRSAWQPTSDVLAQARADTLQLFIERLTALADTHLTRQESISREVMRLRLQNQIDEVTHRMHLIPFNAEGGFYNRLSYVLPRLPFKEIRDYEHYSAWLPQYANSLRQNLSLLRQGLKEGIVASRPVVTNTLSLLEDWAVSEPKVSPLYEPLTRMPASWSSSQRNELEERVSKAIALVNEAYAELREFMLTEYAVAAPEAVGINALPGGDAYYENRVQFYTTLDIGADSVHQLGLAEVTRIRAAMDSIISSVGFTGSYADFLDFLRTDPQFYPRSAEALLHRAAWISKRAEAQLPAFFGTLPRLPFTVAPVPADIAPTYTAGRYVGGSTEQQRPGTYWVNTYNLPSRTLYTLPALTLHEAVPGHHLQNALAAELEALPKFRRNYYISAFGEGWGLYSEFLGEEMGMYTTPYEWFGRYTYEMWRACRLVVDTGIHGKSWSRQRALDYLARNTALSLHEVGTEIDRYIGWPGQAVSYKMGELFIKHLRAQAQSALGDRFDLRDFHDVVLRNGSIPLPVLEQEVMDWVDSAR